MRVLVVEDIPAVKERIVQYLQALSAYDVYAAGSAVEALKLFMDVQPRLVLLDLILPSTADNPTCSLEHGRWVLRRIKELEPSIPVIILSSVDHGEVVREFLVEEGADDYFVKDAEGDWKQQKLTIQLERTLGLPVCRSATMKQVIEEVKELTERDRVVVVEGEPGVGKRYIVSVWHRNMPHKGKRLECIPCATLQAPHFMPVLVGYADSNNQRGLLSAPDIAIIILHHIEDLGEEEQRQLAGLLDGVSSAGVCYHPVGGSEMQVADVRIALTTCSSLESLRESDVITTELFHALDPAHGGIARRIHIPPLRERMEDIYDLVQLFCLMEAHQMKKPPPQVDASVLELIADVPWERNIAQLESVIRQAVRKAADKIHSYDLPLKLPAEYRVVYSTGEGRREEEISRTHLPLYHDSQKFDVILEASFDGKQWHAVKFVVNGNDVEVKDWRLIGLLVSLMENAGEQVELKACKRQLGFARSEPIKRHIYQLRQLLRDKPKLGRRSKYIIGSYGERYTFHANARFCLIRKLKSS